LLGAGFSAPMGYPMGWALGELIRSAVKNIAESGDTYYLRDRFPEILHIMINNYMASHNESFDYEDFFEYIIPYCRDEEIGTKLDKCRISKQIPIEEMGLNYQNDYQRFVCSLLKDGDGNQFYWDQNKHLLDYKNFIGVLESLLDRDYEINIHTLNHDLVFESFKKSPIGNEICDGFDYENVLYYGQNRKGRNVCLPYFNNKYDKKIRLFKLHGSIDQYTYFKNDYYDNHIKISNIVDTDKSLYKLENGRVYEFRFSTITPDFLTGIASKQAVYETRPLYNKLFPQFEENLKQAERLIIVGYGGKDNGINQRIIEHFNRSKPCFIFDPYPSKCLRNFAADIGAQPIIEKRVEEFEIPNF